MISSHRIRLNRFGGQIINNKNRKWMAAFALSNSHERVHHLWQLSHMDSMAIGDFCARTNNNKNNKHCADLSSTASSYDRYVRLQSSIIQNSCERCARDARLKTFKSFITANKGRERERHKEIFWNSETVTVILISRQIDAVKYLLWNSSMFTHREKVSSR